jgi:Protein of unknown function (DUF3054)
MSPRRIPALAFAADVIAVIVFAAVGRLNHGEAESLSGLLATAAPFLIGLVASWATPVVRAHPVGFRAGAVVLAGTAGLGLLLRAAFGEGPPLTFVAVTVISLAVLLLGWRALSLLVSHRTDQRAVR